jgi:bifunctional DNA primase/polymerase-like protein
MSGLFARHQPDYAAHKIATFPVTAAKKPAVQGYLRTGLNGSKELATRFKSAQAFGFATDERNRITVVDIDTPDESVLVRALERHGDTPLIARTGSGKYHAYYKHNGERRRIRPWRDLPIDLLGIGGMVIAPPSRIAHGSYQFIQGTIDDIHRLPVIANLDIEPGPKEGNRNRAVWNHCMKQAHYVENFDELLDVARTFNDSCEPPLEDIEVISAAQSAWGYTERGQNHFGRGNPEIKWMLDNQDAYLLLAFLRDHQGPNATFMCANGLAQTFGWSRLRLAAARKYLIEAGYFKPVRNAGEGTPALFRWIRRRGDV